jgi:hypothetical protein
MRLIVLALLCVCSLGAMESGSDDEELTPAQVVEWVDGQSLTGLGATYRFLFAASQQVAAEEEDAPASD